MRLGGGYAKGDRNMKRRKNGLGMGGWVAVGMVLATALLGGGCERKAAESTSTSASAAPPKGEPIRGEPIAPPATAPATQPVAPVATTVPTAPAAPTAPPNAAPGKEAAVVASTTPATESARVATSAPPVQASSSLAVTSAPAPGKGTAASPLSLAFDKLASFQYALPDGPVDTNVVAQAGATNQIPDHIRSLNNQFVTLKGFMLPLKVEKGLVTELLIMRDQSMCCYGTVPKINEWVSVKMLGTGVKPIMDQAVTLFGKFKVGEMYENGYLVGIYAMDGERMAGPLDM